MKNLLLRWFFSLPATMFYCMAGAALHESQGSPRGPLATAVALNGYVLACGVALWVLADMRQRRELLPYDFGFFVFFAWWVVVPVYLIYTRGWRGFIPLGCFVLLSLAAIVVGNLPAWFLAAGK